eukprot:scaffold770_cov255-Pinguiococcus_pyrenoidosus.AAC.63
MHHKLDAFRHRVDDGTYAPMASTISRRFADSQFRSFANSQFPPSKASARRRAMDYVRKSGRAPWDATVRYILQLKGQQRSAASQQRSEIPKAARVASLHCSPKNMETCTRGIATGLRANPHGRGGKGGGILSSSVPEKGL